MIQIGVFLGLVKFNLQRTLFVSEMPEDSEVKENSLGEVFTDMSLAPEHVKKESEETISKLEGDVMALRSHLRHLDGKRREALNKLLDLKGSIRVFCRIRPFLGMEKRSKEAQITLEAEKVSIQSAGKKKDYIFDKVFSDEVSQEDVFLVVEPILRSALDGHNVCIFAYGQTGTGKTFTMEGTPDCPGIVPRAITALFYQASLDNSVSFKFSLSMMEVYMGNLKDLLSRKSPTTMMESSCNSRCGLHMQTDSNGSIEIYGLTDIPVTNIVQANKSYLMGKRARSTCWTNVNEASSRSHCLSRLTITRSEGGKEVTSKLWMVDLGGSERILKTGATGQTLDEGRAINLSLSALGDVIYALRRKRNHVPYRNSKLTQVLKDSLGVDSKALMVIHISPKDDDVNETICSLNFAQRARGIVCLKEPSQELKHMKTKRISQLNQEIKYAEHDCQNLRDHIHRVECMLREKRIILSNTYARDDQGGPRRWPLTIVEDLYDSSIVQRTNPRCPAECIPRFMSPTVCSRQRQLADKDAKEAKIHKSAKLQSSGPHFHFQSVVSLKSSMHSGLSLRSDSRMPLNQKDSSSVCRDVRGHCNSKIQKTTNIKRLSASPLASQPRQPCTPNVRKRMSDKLNSCELSAGPRWKGTKFVHSSLPNSNSISHASLTIPLESRC